MKSGRVRNEHESAWKSAVMSSSSVNGPHSWCISVGIKVSAIYMRKNCTYAHKAGLQRLGAVLCVFCVLCVSGLKATLQPCIWYWCRACVIRTQPFCRACWGGVWGTEQIHGCVSPLRNLLLLPEAGALNPPDLSKSAACPRQLPQRMAGTL